MKGELHTHVSRPVEEVFDFLADIRNERHWNPRLLSIKKISTGPIGAGSEFEGQYQGLGVLRTELSVFERPHRLGLSE